MKRRSFLAGSLAAPTIFAHPDLAAAAECTEPPVIRPRARQFHFEPSDAGGLLIMSDALNHPRRLVRPEVIDQIWSPGTYETLRQPIHWQMIDDGWFAPEELWFPFTDDYYGADDRQEPRYERDEWYAYYQPACEAHDILAGLFGVSTHFLFGPGSVPELGLEFSEHPSSPRYVTAKLEGPEYIEPFAEEVERRSRYLRIDPVVRAPAPLWDGNLPTTEAD